MRDRINSYYNYKFLRSRILFVIISSGRVLWSADLAGVMFGTPLSRPSRCHGGSKPLLLMALWPRGGICPVANGRPSIPPSHLEYLTILFSVGRGKAPRQTMSNRSPLGTISRARVASERFPIVLEACMLII